MAGLLVAQVSHLKIGQPQVTVACCSTAHEGQVSGVLRLRGRGCWTALDAVVGHLFVGHVTRFFAGHVTAAAVRLIEVVLADKGWGPMAGKASASEICDPLFGRRRDVRIVTGNTGETVPALSLALAFQECFPLAGRSSIGAQFSSVDEVSYIVGKILTRHEGSERAPGGVNRGLAFQVAL